MDAVALLLGLEPLMCSSGLMFGISFQSWKLAWLCVFADLPRLRDMWESYHDAYDVDVLIVPTTPITSRPISDVEPYLSIDGVKVRFPESA